MNELGKNGKTLLDNVKQTVKELGPYLCKRSSEYGRPITQLRFRIIVFRDYLADGKNALMCTDWLTYPQDKEIFEACVDGITADGGGDSPEDGLEALAYAICSPWTTEGSIRRHVIVAWSDAGTHPLGYGRASPHYPEGMAKDMDQLTQWWEQMDERAKRLVLFAPDDAHWRYLSEHWENTIHCPSRAGDTATEALFHKVFDVV